MVSVINPYLMFPGNAEEAFKFYKSVFGGEFANVQRFKDVPAEANNAPAADQDKIMHIALPIGKGNILMASDSLASMGYPVTVGNNFSLSVNAESKADADRVFNALSSGGKIELPMSDMFWGDYFGMCVDKFGIKWMISYNPNQPK